MTAVIRRAEAALVFLASFALAAFVIREKTAVEAFLTSIGPWIAYPLAVLLFTIVASAPFSVTDALAIMNGVIFGPLWGSLVNAVGLVFAAIAGYALARRTSHLLELDKNIQRLPPYIKRFRVGSPAFLLTLRVLPGLGGTLATQIAAAFKVPMFVHVWTMCAIAIPVCTLLAIFGDRVSVAVHDYYEAHRPHVRMHFPKRFNDLFHHRHTPAPEHS
ncbi:MAG: VTT domain-containing protein [Candidatus Eremiobacteraeota bacterium]|nr:VTT domain-containing protein [Candidatus Eremiobacteraeota bacterium]